MKYEDRLNNIYLNKEETLKLSEIECPCCHTAMFTNTMIEKWNRLRELVNAPIIVNSGYRCWNHHVDVYRQKYEGDWLKYITWNSLHLKGQALDLRCPQGLSVYDFYEKAKLAGFTGILIYDWGLHVDEREGYYEYFYT